MYTLLPYITIGITEFILLQPRVYFVYLRAAFARESEFLRKVETRPDVATNSVHAEALISSGSTRAYTSAEADIVLLLIHSRPTHINFSQLFETDIIDTYDNYDYCGRIYPHM